MQISQIEFNPEAAERGKYPHYVPVEVEYASEFRYRNPPLEKHTLVIAITQSGETADNPGRPP